MLALIDAALARLAIAATRIRPDRRRQWLKDIAERIDVSAKATRCFGSRPNRDANDPDAVGKREID
jgi:hypothetical protein